MAISEKDKGLFLEERSGPSEYYVFCQNHGYFGSITTPPHHDCPKCWQVYFIQRYLEHAPGDRKEFLDNLTQAIRYSVEAVKRGEFDIRLFRNPKFEIQKDVPDEEVFGKKDEKS